jgi:hypothetical protein
MDYFNHGSPKWVTSGGVAAAPMLRLAAEPMPITGFVEQRNCGSSLISSLCDSGEEPNPQKKDPESTERIRKVGWRCWMGAWSWCEMLSSDVG